MKNEEITLDTLEFYSLISEGEGELVEKFADMTEETLDRADLGKGYSSYHIILQRCNDEKYFKVEYIKSPNGSFIYMNGETVKGIEVFPHKVTNIIYTSFPS